jgi:hypothetical protein
MSEEPERCYECRRGDILTCQHTVPSWFREDYKHRYTPSSEGSFQTGSKLMDLILTAGEYGWMLRKDDVLRDEVIALIQSGEDVGFAGSAPNENSQSLGMDGDFWPQIMGCYPSRWAHRDDARNSLLTNALYLRIPVVAEVLLHHMTPDKIRVGEPIKILERGAATYVGHKREYKKMLKLAKKKLGEL